MDEQLIELFDLYQSEKLSKHDMFVFSWRLNNNPELKKQYNQYLTIIRALKTKYLGQKLINLESKHSI